MSDLVENHFGFPMRRLIYIQKTEEAWSCDKDKRVQSILKERMDFN